MLVLQSVIIHVISIVSVVSGFQTSISTYVPYFGAFMVHVDRQQLFSGKKEKNQSTISHISKNEKNKEVHLNKRHIKQIL
jgi:predicted tellurium resistance membrane protein TerC